MSFQENELDLSKCWNDAVALMRANKEIVLILAGLFLFVPQVLLSLLIGDPPQPTSDSIAAAQSTMWEWIGDAAPYIFVASVLSIIGTLSILFVALNPAKPTVGEAIKMALGMFIFYFIAQILGTIVSLTGMLLLIIPGVYLAVKFSLFSMVAAAENERNPIAMMKRSWELTKGNSLRLFGLYLLIAVAALVAIIVLGAIFVLLFTALLPDSIALTAGAFVDAFLQSAMTVLMLHVGMAAYRQLSGQSAV